MNKDLFNKDKYLTEIKNKSKKSKVYKDYQMTGLLISQILGDNKYKSLYIKLAKMYNKDKLLALAKSVSENNNVLNRGAYFMKLVALSKKEDQKTESGAEN